MGSIDIFKSSREAYRSKHGFDKHTTTRHSVADSFADQLKGAWFCAQKWLLNPMKDHEDNPCCYPFDSSGQSNGSVPKAFLDVWRKEQIKSRKTLNLNFDSFPELRYERLLYCVQCMN